jgi:serine/threonine protein kinase
MAAQHLNQVRHKTFPQMPSPHFTRLNQIRSSQYFKHYRLLEQIGEGGQGSIWSALDSQNDQVVAIKFSEISGSSERKPSEDVHLQRQIGKLMRLRHPYILPIIDYGTDDLLRYIISPYIPGGSLENLIGSGPIPVQKVMTYAAKIAAALEYLHKQGVIHRDLKPSNVLLDITHNIYLSDFGLARVISNNTQAMHTGRGTPYYAPPEQHTMSEALQQSDIYSFGIVLYELLTDELPWRGEKMLGIQQLQAREELPDLRDIVADLPADLTLALRQITATLPEARPETIQQAMQLLYQASGCPPIPVESAENWTEDRIKNLNAIEIYEKSHQYWRLPDSTVPLSLTAFALLDTTPEAEQALRQSPQFALNSALIYGYKHEEWWQKTQDLGNRLAVAVEILESDTEDIRSRVTTLLAHDTELQGETFSTQSPLVKSILKNIGLTQKTETRYTLLSLLTRVLPAGQAWQPMVFSQQEDALIAYQALEDSPVGDQAARLIGHLRAEKALQTVYGAAAPQRRLPILLTVLQNAGSLPAFIPQSPRLEAYLEWILTRAFATPAQLGLLALSSLVGAGLGFGVYTYAVYRLNVFLDTARFLTAVQHGLFIGAGFALMIPLVRVIIEQFPKIPGWRRSIIATLLGGLPVTSVLLLYHALLLERYEILQAANLGKSAFLLAACLVIPLGFSLASLVRARLLKTFSYALTLFLALFGSWWAHLHLSLRPFPLLYYEYTWPLSQVLALILFIAVSTAIGAGLPPLNPPDEPPTTLPNPPSVSSQ